MRSVAIYSPADRLAQHRYKADESFCVGEKNTPVGAYLDFEARVARRRLFAASRPCPAGQAPPLTRPPHTPTAGHHPDG